MRAVIMAGGLGTRLASLCPARPKSMVEIAGKPILQWQLDCLHRQGICDITLVIGHLGGQIKQYLGNQVKYIEETEPLGTAGSLYYLRNHMKEDFLLINGDIIFDVDFTRIMAFHKRSGAAATIVAHPNDHPFDSGLLRCDSSGKVLEWYERNALRPVWYHNLSSSGIYVLSPDALEQCSHPVRKNLDQGVLRPMIEHGGLYAFHSAEYIHDAGTPERFLQTQRDIQSGVVAKKNAALRQKAVFIDRDGTINRYKGFLSNIDDFELLDTAAESIRQINHTEYLTICVTNQPVIARGELSFEGLTEIHNKMETLLGQEGAYLDDIVFCPHHPDSGFEGEIKELKIRCNCRKPDTGMLEQMAEKYNIDLAESIMVGDSEIDRMTAERVGCQLYFVSLKKFMEEFYGNH